MKELREFHCSISLPCSELIITTIIYFTLVSWLVITLLSFHLLTMLIRYSRNHIGTVLFLPSFKTTKSSGMTHVNVLTGDGGLAMTGVVRPIRACSDAPGKDEEREGGESIGLDFSPLSGSTSTGTSNLLEALGFLLSVDIMLPISETSNSSLSSVTFGREL